MRLSLIATILAALTLAGCGRQGQGPQGGAAPDRRDGGGVLLVFARKQAIWIQIRASAESRTNGWVEPVSGPVLVAYAGRGFNPVFTNGKRLQVAWIDGDRIVKTEEAQAETRYLAPPQEITAAMLLPEAMDPGLKAGDRIVVVENQP